jgi:tRNA 2-selenouridine synthase
MNFLAPVAFLEESKSLPVVDVRSPAEYRQGHIPGAINMPLFDDEERKITGTLYKNSGRYDSFLRGLELVGPKLAQFVKTAHKLAPQHSLALHCWRGGLRSQSMAWLFETAGFQVSVLEGGYKAYRRHVLQSFSNINDLLVLGGMTGSGKSLILRELAEKGEQIIDLELLANHKGSAFGGIGQDTQPTNEQFENNLNVALSQLNPEKHTWIEDESQGIGRVQIPGDLFQNMRNAPVFFIEIPQKRRVDRLVKEYGEKHRDVLTLSIQQVSKRLGGLNTKTALEAIDKGDFKLAATILLTYYDKAYLEGLTKRNSEKVHHFASKTDDPLKNASRILKWKQKLENLSERA